MMETTRNVLPTIKWSLYFTLYLCQNVYIPFSGVKSHDSVLS